MGFYGEESPEGECSSWNLEERKCLQLKMESEKMLKSVVRLLDAGNSTSVICEGASRMLSCIDNGVFSREDLGYIGSQPAVVEGIVSLFSLNNSRVRRWIALEAFYNLAKCETNKMRLVSSPGAVRGLVNLFSRTVDTSIQLMSLEVFSLLSESPEISIDLASTPGVMTSLVETVLDNSPVEIQNSAVFVLNLLFAATELKTHCGNIHPRSRIIQRYLQLFSGESRTKFRRAASAFLAHLAKYEEDETALVSHVETIANVLQLPYGRKSVHKQLAWIQTSEGW